MSKYEAFKKVVRIGTGRTWERGSYVSTYCSVVFTADGRLSITGVAGPTHGGNCVGGCGQIVDDIKVTNFAKGWDRKLMNKFIKVWKEWHLNDMQSACEHQRKDKEFGTKPLKVAELALKTSVRSKQESLKKKALGLLIDGETVKLPILHRDLLSLEPYLRVPVGDGYEIPEALLENYDVKREEAKTSGWLTEKEHPEGVLSKPCPECGHKYGNAWLKMDVPEDVLDFLKSLPDTDKTPAWV